MIKQLIFMVPSFITGTFGCFYIHPYIGVLIYYLYAVLRPQFIWAWSLPEYAWSFYVAIATILSTVAWRIGVLSFEDEGNCDIETNIGHYCVYGYAVWIVVVYFTSYSRDVAYDNLVEYSKIFIMFITARYALITINHVWNVYVTIVVVLCYIAYEMNEIYFSTGYLFVYRRGYGGLDNNGAALILAMGVPMCLYLWDGIRHWVRWVFVSFIAVIVHAVLTSFSRGAMVSLLVTLPIYLLRCRQKRQLTIIYICSVILIPILAGKEIRERFFTLQHSELDESANSRRNSWSIALKLVDEKPIFGFGLRNSNLFTHAYGADIEGRTIHSQWLQIAADCGYPGLVLYISCFIAMLYICKNVRKSVEKRDDIHARRVTVIVNGCEGSLLVFCVGATFLSLETFELPYVMLLLAAQLWSICKVTNAFDNDFNKP